MTSSAWSTRSWDERGPGRPAAEEVEPAVPARHLARDARLLLPGLPAHRRRGGTGRPHGGGISGALLRRGQLARLAGAHGPLLGVLLSGGFPRHLAGGALVQRTEPAFHRHAADPCQRL